MRIKTYLYTILLIALNSSCSSNKIVVVGMAQDDKDAAIVVTDQDKVYLLDGLDEWSARYYGRKVRVTGKLKTEIHEKQSTDSMQVQERVGTWLIIKKPKWSLIE